MFVRHIGKRLKQDWLTEAEAVHRVIDLANDPNEVCNDRSLLMIAALNNHVEVVRLLLEKGVNVTNRDPRDETVLMLAT